MLNERLKELREADFIELGNAGYALTALGRELSEKFMPLHHFAEKWSGRCPFSLSPPFAGRGLG